MVKTTLMVSSSFSRRMLVTSIFLVMVIFSSSLFTSCSAAGIFDEETVYFTDDFGMRFLSNFSTDPTALFIEDGLAFLVDTTLGLTVVDVSDPTIPTLVTNFEDVSGAVLTKSGDYLFTGDSSLRIFEFTGDALIELTTPESSHLLSQSGSSFCDIAVSNNIVVTLSTDYLTLYNSTSLSHPLELFSVHCGIDYALFFNSFIYIDRYLLVSAVSQNGGLVTYYYDLNTLSNFTSPPDIYTLNSFRGRILTIDGNFIYIYNNTIDLLRYNSSNFPNITLDSFVFYEGYLDSILLYNGYLISAFSQSSKFSIYDVRSNQMTKIFHGSLTSIIKQMTFEYDFGYFITNANFFIYEFTLNGSFSIAVPLPLVIFAALPLFVLAIHKRKGTKH